MSKTSFARPGAAQPAAASPVKKPAAPVAAKPAPPTTRPATPPAKPVPAKPVAAKPAPVAPAGVKTNVGKPGQPVAAPKPAAAPAKPAPVAPRKFAKPAPQPEPEPEPEEEQPEEQPEEVVEVEAELEQVEEQPEEQPEETIEEEQPGTELAVVEGNLASSENLISAPVGSGIGELDAGDFEIPRLKLMQAMSPLVVEQGLTAGDWVLNDESILWQKECAPIELTVLKLQKQFMEQKEFGSDDMPRIFNSAAEAQAEGLTLFGGDDQGYVAIATAIVLIKQPEGVECSCFTEEFEGSLYALAIWQITGIAYKFAGRKLWTEQKMRLKHGFHTGGFTLEARLEKGAKNSYWAPQLRAMTGLHSDEFIEFAINVGGGAA